MFDNIGGKIKTMATIFCILGIVASAICAFTLWGSSNRYNDSTLTGLIVLIGGSLASWLGSFFTYGFGELIEQNQLLLVTNREILTQLKFSTLSPNSSTLKGASTPNVDISDRISFLAHNHSDSSATWVCSECNAANPSGNNCCQSCGTMR